MPKVTGRHAKADVRDIKVHISKNLFSISPGSVLARRPVYSHSQFSTHQFPNHHSTINPVKPIKFSTHPSTTNPVALSTPRSHRPCVPPMASPHAAGCGVARTSFGSLASLASLASSNSAAWRGICRRRGGRGVPIVGGATWVDGSLGE